ncbi:MAG: RdgB/HAM1 family non-canonical purine NTP pyrophosphatase [Pseudomonadota bacterium]|nr:RdgB/HAM1 family non-canonical purine NTP pyrophosphatase [Pseudomonadota bacterium]
MRLAGQTLVIASHNAGKVEEIGEMLAPLSIRAISATEAEVAEPEETGSSFAENASLKSEHAAQASGLISLADDSGLVVPAIGGAPGIYSARWAGPGKDFSVAFKRIRTELGAKSPDAYFICTLALSVPGKDTQVFEGRIDGRLTFPPRGNKGFGYDPIFIPHGYDITFGEMDPMEKNRISHRARAFAEFLKSLKEGA